MEGSECLVTGNPNSTGYDNQSATNRNSLCPGATGKQTRVLISGVPNAAVTVNYRLPIQEQNGVRFGWRGKEHTATATATLSNNNGTHEAVMGSSITLFDKSLVTDSVMVFNYEISAAYQ